MSKTLYLIRHAHAEGAESGQKDVERNLTSVGARDANRLGMYLANSQINPDLIMVSHADRAWATAGIVAEQLRYGTDKIVRNEELYEAPIRILLKIINELPEKMECVILVGHNPGISFLADYLTSEDIGNMTPCTAIAIEFEVDDWSLVASNTGNSKFIRIPD